MQSNDAIQDIRDAGQIQHLLEALKQSGQANLYLEETDGAAWPVRVLAVQAGEALRLDVGRAAEIKPLLAAGSAFRLVGEAEGAMVRTAPLVRLGQETSGGRGQCLCSYPEALEVALRRSAFRADLTDGMDVPVELALPGRDEPIRGVLKNLSVGGCLSAVALPAAVKLFEEERTVGLTARFPNGQRLHAEGRIRHVRPDDAWTAGLVGYEFAPADQAFERQLWYLAQEIQRQQAYEQSESDRASPSELFQAAPSARNKSVARTHADRGPTAMALGKIAASLDAQLLQVKAGAPIAIRPLMHQSAQLLELLGQNREALLYGIACLSDEPGLVQHGLSVAARLADLAVLRQVETQRLQAVVACALIHDFGKVMLPAAITQSRQPLTAEQRTTLATHVKYLTDRLGESEALPADVVTAIIELGNERLDGSGYPAGRSDDELPELACMMAVVDVADAMRRRRADRNAWPQSEVYRHLLLAHTQFDNAWVQRYIRRFGMIPIGTLAKFSSGRLAWIQRLDEEGKPAQVKVVMNVSNRRQRLDETLHDGDVEQLGRFEALVEPQEYGLEP